MVTRAAKDLLKNTIRSTDYHNKQLEEEEMWRHWELQKGLTMMVTDDYLRMRMDGYPELPSSNGCQRRRRHRHSRRRHHQRREYERHGKSPTPEYDHHKRLNNYKFTRELVQIEEQDPDRWGHSGYIEMYPEEFQVFSKSKSESPDYVAHNNKSDDSNDDDKDDDENEEKKTKSHRKSRKTKHRKSKHKRRRSKKRKSSHFDTDSETSELRQDIRNEQRKRRGLEPVRRKRRGDSSDSDVRIIGISGPRKAKSDGVVRTS